jgi:hypothetical protein
MSIIPHSLDNRLTDGGKFDSPTHRPRSTPQKHYSSASDTHFCYRLSKPYCLVTPEGFAHSRAGIYPSLLSTTWSKFGSFVHIMFRTNSETVTESLSINIILVCNLFRATLSAKKSNGFLVYSSTLKMEAKCSAITSAGSKRSTQRCIPGYRTLQEEADTDSFTCNVILAHTIQESWSWWLGLYATSLKVEAR